MPVRNIALIVKTKSGRVAEPSSQHPFTIKAQSGATYSVINKETNAFPEDLLVKRNGNALEIEVEQEVAIRIENFYGDKVKATFSTDGSLTPAKGMAITSSSIAAADPETTETVWQSSTHDEDSSAPWFWAAGALGAASVATALASSSDDGSSGSSPQDEFPNSGTPGSGYDIVVNAAAGPFQSAPVVEVYDTNGTLLTSGEYDAATGQVRLNISNGYQGPVLVRVIDNNGSDGDYINETSNALVNLDQPLRAMGSADGSGDLVISVTPLTELAVRHAGITDNAVNEDDLAANGQIAELFGVENLLAPFVTVLGASYDSSDGYSPDEHYGAVLAQLSGADTVTGSLSATLDQLETEIVDQGAGDLALTSAGAELLAGGTEAFSDGPNRSIADLTETLTQHPQIDAASGGISEAEKNAGIVVKIPDAGINDKVTLYWGDQTLSVIISEINFSGSEPAAITLPGSMIDAAGTGEIPVYYQLNDGEESSTVIVTVSPTATSVDSLSVSLSDDTGSSAADFITREASQTITATLNSELTEGEVLYGSVDAGGSWIDITDQVVNGTSLIWSGVTLSGSSSIQFKVIGTTGNEGEIVSQPYVVDTIAPAITIEPVASDGIINAEEDDTDIIISGTGSDVEDGQTVTVGLNSSTYTGTVSDGLWSVTVPAAALQLLVEGDHTVTADISDAAGNVADQATHTITHDSILPTVSINPIATDGIINGIEDDSAVVITGFCIGVENGQTVTVSLNGQTYSGTVTNNLWSTIVQAADVQALPEGVISVTADVSDAAGNEAPQAVSSVIHNSAAPEVSIDIVAGDDMINAVEDNSDIIISGTTSNVENGQTVTVTLDGRNYSGTVTDNVWSVTVRDRRVRELTEGTNTITANVSDLAGNEAVQATRDIIYDKEAPTIAIGTVSGDNIINAVEDDSGLTVTGTTTGVEDGQTVTVSLNAQSYTGVVTGSVWNISVPAAAVQALPQGASDITADVSDLAGNPASQAVSPITHDSEAPTVTIDTIATDGIINSAEDDTSVSITGTSSGVENGQTVTVNLNGQTYTGNVNADAWSVTVPSADAQALTEGGNDLTADVSDAAGNSAQATGSVIYDSISPTVSYSDAGYNENTLTLTGVNVNTLLSDGESSTTDLQDNFDWSRLTWNIDGDDGSPVTFSGADIAGVYALTDSTLAITLESGKADSLEATENFDPLITGDTITVTNGFSGDTSGNISATDGFTSPSHVDESIVVFDTVNKTSSGHSGREFDADISYSIYILVDDNGLAPGPLPPDKQWANAERLGEDDNIVLVSNSSGSPIQGQYNGNVTSYWEYPDTQVWYTGFNANSVAFSLQGDGDAVRYWSGANASYDLWRGNFGGTQWGGTGLHTLATMPAGIMTSQGLA